jgi:hypothetical protein
MTVRFIAIGVLMLVAPVPAADRRVQVDPNTDFSIFRTFAVRAGAASSRNPEIDNVLTMKKVEDTVRRELVARGLKETPDPPDLIVTFSVSEGAQRGAPPPGQRGARRLSAGTLIIDMTRRDTRTLVWHGTYSDTVDSPGTLAGRLPGYARNLLSEFPPKKK